MMLNRVCFFFFMFFLNKINAFEYEIKVDKGKTHLGINSVVYLQSSSGKAPYIEEISLPENTNFTSIYVLYNHPFSGVRKTKRMSYVLLQDSEGRYHIYYSRYYRDEGVLRFSDSAQSGVEVADEGVFCLGSSPILRLTLIKFSRICYQQVYFVTDFLTWNQSSSQNYQSDTISFDFSASQPDRVSSSEAIIEAYTSRLDNSACNSYIISAIYLQTPSPRYLYSFQNGSSQVVYVPWSSRSH